MTPDDMEGRLEKLREWDTLHPPDFEALRALLLAYQERGRALEFVRGEARRGQTVRPGDACLVLIEARARASLKGKSHD
jgi:hypothetical protein